MVICMSMQVESWSVSLAQRCSDAIRDSDPGAMHACGYAQSIPVRSWCVLSRRQDVLRRSGIAQVQQALGPRRCLRGGPLMPVQVPCNGCSAS